jgi:hypothetical protein
VLLSLDILPGNRSWETTGAKLADGGIRKIEAHLDFLSEGGVYFIDETYQLVERHNRGGKAVLDYLTTKIEEKMGVIVFVFAGYHKRMEKLFQHSLGLSSRMPLSIHLEDYTDKELLRILWSQMANFYTKEVSVEGGGDGLYMRIAVRRLGRGRGRDGFGNARSCENMFSKIRDRQSARLRKERRAGFSPDDLFITKEDLIGPDPSQAFQTCQAWEELQSLTGLDSVKHSVSVLIDLVKTNYARELSEKPLVEMPLNRVFLGAPGTGKTTVAKLYGRILCDIGLLSDGEGK